MRKRALKRYIRFAHNQIKENSVKNKLEVAITLVVTDYTRIRYASCGNIKFYLMDKNSFLHKSNTQTYYQFAIEEYGLDKASIVENRNLLQYLGKPRAPKPYISKKILIPEKSTMLFVTCNLWERVSDIEILDAYEDSKPDELLTNLEELYLVTQKKYTNIKIRSYTIVSLFIEKAFKEDTQRQKKIRRRIIIFSIILLVLLIIGTIILLTIRRTDRRAFEDIERLSNSGSQLARVGNFNMAYEQYREAYERMNWLVGRRNLQFRRRKRELHAVFPNRFYLIRHIVRGDEYSERGDLHAAASRYREAYNLSHAHPDLIRGDAVTGRLERNDRRIALAHFRHMSGLYQYDDRILNRYYYAYAYLLEAETLAIDLNDWHIHREVMQELFLLRRRMFEEPILARIPELRRAMVRYENARNFGRAEYYARQILDIAEDLDIDTVQPQADVDRISQHGEIYNEAHRQANQARGYYALSEYNDALILSNIVLGLFRRIGISFEYAPYVEMFQLNARLQQLLDETARDEAREAQVLDRVTPLRGLMRSAENEQNYELAAQLSADILDIFVNEGMEDALARYDFNRLHNTVELQTRIDWYRELMQYADDRADYERAAFYSAYILNTLRVAGINDIQAQIDYDRFHAFLGYSDWLLMTRGRMHIAEITQDYERAARYSRYILNTLTDIGINDAQAQEDYDRLHYRLELQIQANLEDTYSDED